MYSCPFPSEKIAVHGLLRLLNGHVVIELTSVKKGLSPFPFFYICGSQLSYIETTDLEFEWDAVVWSLIHSVLTELYILFNLYSNIFSLAIAVHVPFWVAWQKCCPSTSPWEFPNRTINHLQHTLYQVLKHGDEPSDCESSCLCYYCYIEGLGSNYLLYKHQWNTKPFHFNRFLVWKVRFIM